MDLLTLDGPEGADAEHHSRYYVNPLPDQMPRAALVEEPILPYTETINRYWCFHGRYQHIR